MAPEEEEVEGEGEDEDEDDEPGAELLAPIDGVMIDASCFE